MSKEPDAVRIGYARTIKCGLSGSECRVMDAYISRRKAHNLIEAEMGCEDAKLQITDKHSGESFIGVCVEPGRECGRLIVTAEPNR